MANLLKIKRGTRAQLNAAVTGNSLNLGEPYLITDEGRIAIGTGSNTYVDFAKSSEITAIDADLIAIAALTGTGFLKRTGANTWVLDTNTYLTAESDTLNSVVGRGASTSTAVTLSGGVTVNAVGSSNGVIFTGSTSGSTKVVASAAAGSTTITLPATTGTVALTTDLPTVNNAGLTVSISGTAASSGTALAWGTTSGFTANASTGSTYDLRVGPALSALATLMTTAGAGFIRRGASADTYTIDTNTYLTGNQSISLTGDATGTGTTSISVTLKNTGTAGTYTKVTTDAQGRVTTGTTLSATDIPTLTASKISDFDTQVRTSRLDQMAAPTASVSFNSQNITGLANPVNAQDAATKNYVDSAVQGLDPKASVKAATTASITLSGEQTIDGISIVNGDRVLVKNQSSLVQNGIYVASASAWSRASDADTWNELISAYVFVEQGTTNGDNGYLITVDAGGTLGVNDVNIVQFNGAGQITAGAGLTKTGNQLDVGGTSNRITVNSDSIDIASTYVGQSSITTLGTIGTGTWQGTAIGTVYGGTGLTSYATGDLLYASGSNTLAKLTKPGVDDSILFMSSAGTPSWSNTVDGGTF